MPWILPLLMLLAGTGMQVRAEKAKDRATRRGINDAQAAEGVRQSGFERKIALEREKVAPGLTAEKQSAVADEAAARRQALYDSTAIRPADAGYVNPAESAPGPRVIRTDADQVRQKTETAVAQQGAARARMSANADMKQAETERLTPILSEMGRQYGYSRRSAEMLPQEVQNAIVAGSHKGQRTAMGGQLLSTLGTLLMASPQFASGVAGLFRAAPTALPEVVAESAVPGAMSAAGGMQMSLAPVPSLAARTAPTLTQMVDATAPTASSYLRSIGSTAVRGVRF